MTRSATWPTVDERARALLERTEALTAADMARLHGTLRDPYLGASNGAASDPWRAIDAKPQLAFLRVHGADLKVGDRVRLAPKGGGFVETATYGFVRHFEVGPSLRPSRLQLGH